MKQRFELSKRQSGIILALSLCSAILISVTGVAGIFIPGTYFRETVNWTLQSMGQDFINLFLILPIFVTALILTLKRVKIGFVIWGGINLYLVYTYVIYSFDIHFNRLFPVYCLVLGLSFYSFLFFIYLSIKKRLGNLNINTNSVRLTSGYFLTIACMFAFLWMSQIVPAVILHTVPAELIDTGLITNPVHVLDLAIFLPSLFITSVLLLAKNPLGILFAPVLLVFCVLMSLAIACLIYAMSAAGSGAGYTVTMMGLLTVTGILLFADYFKRSLKTS